MYTGSGKQWYAVRTAAGREKAVSGQLGNKGYEHFLPVYRTKRQWSDRVKEVELPLFPGYLFCRFDINSRLPILVTPGVKLIVGYGKAPIPICENEMDAIRTGNQGGSASGAMAVPGGGPAGTNSRWIPGRTGRHPAAGEELLEDSAFRGTAAALGGGGSGPGFGSSG